MSRKQFLL
ncbi:hypothetical protein CGLO_16682 [Colletotrichum gloeosporioides Cg-14]|uniref:Uncharacterized protein n=1 Tax=Colletotrichum gloeosporioides (strain Cg-14) TaxID=1237896 RepID=T0JN16_COLGC|nr:hypothetical protein CGLO_16682 [Colletotrichum gloeosporioides Cg-14]